MYLLPPPPRRARRRRSHVHCTRLAPVARTERTRSGHVLVLRRACQVEWDEFGDYSEVAARVEMATKGAQHDAGAEARGVAAFAVCIQPPRTFKRAKTLLSDI